MNQKNISDQNDSILYLYYNSKKIDSFPNKQELIAKYDWARETSAGTDVDPEDDSHQRYNVEKPDFEFGFRLIDESLKKQNFKPVTEELFYKRLEEVFGITEESIVKSNYIISLYDFFAVTDYSDDKNHPELVYSLEMRYKYFCTKYRFICGSPIAYVVSEKREDNNLNLVPNEYLYHSNMYYFYGSNASLRWMINNAIGVLYELVVKYGYDKDHNLNKAVLEDYIFKNNDMSGGAPDYSQLKDVFFKKDLNNNFSIRTNFLHSLEKETNKQNLVYIFAFTGYISYFFSEYSPEKNKYSIKELAEIFVNVAVVEERMRTAYFDPATPEWNNRSHTYYISEQNPKLLEIAKEYNYFGIPFDDVLEMFQWDSEPNP